MIIAVDGPSGAGKGTISRAIAQHFSLKHIDTGLYYRAIAYKAILEGIDLKHEDVLVQLVDHITTDDFLLPVLRAETIGNAASKIAVIPIVREQITRRIHRFCQEIALPYKGVVLDGRDIGTVVCPNATVKIFVTANPDVRANRRSMELKILTQQNSNDILNQINQRDERDQRRIVSPLSPASDAIFLDTSELSSLESCNCAINIVLNYLSTNSGLVQVTSY
ncbi:MAG: (d)CMP kinase [Candidatus Paracaedibacteraceae bacterium]|nr:(d)CMP kinase [Candidatus Paracaedibacteraceae bacterium]